MNSVRNLFSFTEVQRVMVYKLLKDYVIHISKYVTSLRFWYSYVFFKFD